MRDSYLVHHGIKGQKWGVRRYQNPDGSLTPQGRARIISAHERRGRNIGKVVGSISGYVAYNNGDKIADKTGEAVSRSTQQVRNKAREVTKPARITANKIASKATDDNNFKKLRDKTGEITKESRKNIKKISKKGKEVGKTIADDPRVQYESGRAATYLGSRVGEAIGGATGRTIGRVSANIQDAYGRHVVKRNKRKAVKHAIVYADIRPSFVDQLDIDYISHHGIKGMKWGVRRYQNADGSLTPAGEKRYSKSVDNAIKLADSKGNTRNRAAVTEQYMKEWMDSPSSKRITEFDNKHGIQLNPDKGEMKFPVDRHGNVDANIMNKRNALYKQYTDEGERLYKKYADTIAGAILRDIGEKDTRRGRQFMRQYYLNQ